MVFCVSRWDAPNIGCGRSLSVGKSKCWLCKKHEPFVRRDICSGHEVDTGTGIPNDDLTEWDSRIERERGPQLAVDNSRLVVAIDRAIITDCSPAESQDFPLPGFVLRHREIVGVLAVPATKPTPLARFGDWSLPISIKSTVLVVRRGSQHKINGPWGEGRDHVAAVSAVHGYHSVVVVGVGEFQRMYPRRLCALLLSGFPLMDTRTGWPGSSDWSSLKWRRWTA